MGIPKSKNVVVVFQKYFDSLVTDGMTGIWEQQLLSSAAAAGLCRRACMPANLTEAQLCQHALR